MALREIVSFDWAIKNILRDKANYSILEGFLLALIGEDITINDDLDEWLYAFKHHEVKDEFKSVGIKELGEKLNFVAMDPETQNRYKKYLEDLASDRGTMELNTLRAEKKKAREIAKNLLALNTSEDVIIKATGLRRDEIEELEIQNAENKIS